MVAFSKIKAGDTLYDCHIYQAGVGKRMGTWMVKVIEVNRDKQTAIVSWNSNRPEIWGFSRMQRLRRSPPKKAM